MPINLFKQYEVDIKRETEGVDIDIDGAVFICKRAGGNNRPYRAAISEYADKHRADLESKDQATQLRAEDEITMGAFFDTVVLGWREILGRDDQPLEFNRENFIDLMRSCPDVWVALRARARDVENFRHEKIKEAGTELGKSSSGSESGAST